MIFDFLLNKTIPVSFSFLLGNPRSGTTLLRLLLNAHSNIVSPPEGGFLQWLAKEYQHADFSVQNTVEGFVDALLQTKKFETWGLTKAQIMAGLNKHGRTNYEAAVKSVYRTYGDKYDQGASQHIVDKNNYFIHHMDEIHGIVPTAKYIHLVRDPRDVACSYLAVNKLETSSPYKPKLPAELQAIGEEWSRNNASIRTFLSDKPHFTVVYEELLESPAEVLQGLCAFLDIPFEEGMLDFHKKNDEPGATMDWKKQTSNPLNPKNKGKYLQILSPEEQGIILAETKVEMANYYEV